MTASASPLAGRVALVTGASAGIGRGIALHFAALGADVVLHARREDRLRALAGEIEAAGGRALVVPGDAGEMASVDALFAAAVAWKGHVDVAVVNAGRGLAGGVMTSDVAHWESLYRTNVTGAIYLMRLAATHMGERGSGDIVAVGSVAGHNISSFSGFYGSSKWAIAGAAEALRREVCSRGVRVTLVMPGVVQSEFQEVAGYTPDNFGKTVAKWGTPLQPEDLARAVGFVVTQPAHVHINEFVIRPTGQDYP